MFTSQASIVFLSLVVLGCAHAQTPSDEDIRVITSQIWDADVARMIGDAVQYNVNGPRFFTYVNETHFTDTYASMIALFDNYVADVAVAEICGAPCRVEENTFLDDLLATPPMQMAHEWLSARGLAAVSVAEWREEVRQYWFQLYTRSSGPLGSSGFEHVFVGETRGTSALGFHNWVNMYFQEKSGAFVYGTYQATCDPEIPKFGFTWNGFPKSISSVFMRTSPEAEIALYTVCFRARLGPSCPVRMGDVETLLTTWDMSGVLPRTIGSAWPNC